MILKGVRLDNKIAQKKFKKAKKQNNWMARMILAMLDRA